MTHGQDHDPIIRLMIPHDIPVIAKFNQQFPKTNGQIFNGTANVRVVGKNVGTIADRRCRPFCCIQILVRKKPIEALNIPQGTG